MAGSSEHELKHGKSYLTHLIPLYDEMTGLVDEGRWPWYMDSEIDWKLAELPDLEGFDQQH